jgi:hypothetical protein
MEKTLPWAISIANGGVKLEFARDTGSHPDPNASLERAGIYIRSKPWISSHGSVNPV